MNVISLSTIVVLGCGMLGTATHLGKPGRMLNAIYNPTSHLTLEMITCIPVAACYLLIGLDGWLYTLPKLALTIAELVGIAASVAFVWVTALAYQLKARPAWASVFTPLNFMLTFLSAGAVGACFFAAAFTHELSVAPRRKVFGD